MWLKPNAAMILQILFADLMVAQLPLVLGSFNGSVPFLM